MIFVLQECMSKFPMAITGQEKVPENEKFIMNMPSTSPTDQVCKHSEKTVRYVMKPDKDKF